MTDTIDFATLTWFVIPAYNEAPVVQKVLTEISTMYPNVILVDDGSSDATGDEARAAGVYLLTHSTNLGQGAALQTGLEFAMRNNAQYIVTFDADGQHCLDDVSTMLDLLISEKLDVVLGSRFYGTADNIPYMRRLFLRAAVLFTRLSTGLRLTDVHNGLRVLNANAASKIQLTQNGMAHASEFLKLIQKQKLAYAEAPVKVRYTEYSLGKGQKLSNSVNILMDLFIQWITK